MDSDKKLQELVSRHFAAPEKDASVLACPGEEILHDYMQGALEPAVQQDVERHLVQCDRCTETMFLAAAVLDEPVSAAPVPEGLHELLLERLSPRPTPWFRNALQTFKARCATMLEDVADFISGDSPEFVYVRGSRQVISQSLVVLEKVFKDIKLEIEIEKTGDHATDIKVMVTHPKTGCALNGTRLNLSCGGSELASFGVVRGQVLFEHIAFGEYRLSAWKEKKKLGEVLLTIEE